MKKNQHKKRILTITLILVLTTLFVLPINSTAAQTEITSYAYMQAIPNPIGVHQTTYITMWVDAPLPDATVDNDIRRHDYTLTITKPDGSSEVRE